MISYHMKVGYVRVRKTKRKRPTTLLPKVRMSETNQNSEISGRLKKVMQGS